jgi:hypothetical protein
MPARKAKMELEALRGVLRGEIPAGVEKLEPEHLADLTTAIGEARRRQGEALQEAGDRALRHIPRLLRGPIRRVVG